MAVQLNGEPWKFLCSKAFALDPKSNAFGWAWGGERPIARALAGCQRNAKSICRLYAVDQDVVWVAE
jgi:hypothetical protein